MTGRMTQLIGIHTAVRKVSNPSARRQDLFLCCSCPSGGVSCGIWRTSRAGLHTRTFEGCKMRKPRVKHPLFLLLRHPARDELGDLRNLASAGRVGVPPAVARVPRDTRRTSACERISLAVRVCSASRATPGGRQLVNESLSQSECVPRDAEHGRRDAHPTPMHAVLPTPPTSPTSAAR